MTIHRIMRLGFVVIALLGSASIRPTPARAATNPLANTKWEVDIYSLNGVVTELPVHRVLAGPTGRTLFLKRTTYVSRLDCLGDGGRYTIGNRAFIVQTTYPVKPAVLCPDSFLSTFLLSKPRFRLSVDKQTLELRNNDTGQRLLLNRL